MKYKNNGNSNLAGKDLLLFFLYLFSTLLLVFVHEQWEDELQVWCIARELDLAGIFHQMRYEGHFALWYLLFKPIAVLKTDPILLNIVSWFLCVISSCLFLQHSKFRFPVKILVLLSAPALYYFPVIARNYALIPLALCCISLLYPVRMKRPYVYALSLLLLVHSHAYMEGLAGILGIFFAWDLIGYFRKKPWRKMLYPAGSLLLLAGGVLAAFLQVYPAFGSSSFAPTTFGDVWKKPDLLHCFGETLVLLATSYAEFLTKSCGVFPLVTVFYLILCAGVAGLFFRSRRAGWIFLIGFIWQILFSIFIYRFAMHRVYLPFFMLIFCYTLPPDRVFRKRAEHTGMIRFLTGGFCIAAAAVLTIPDSFFYALRDIQRPFSNQGHAAAMIEKLVPPDSKIVVFPSTLITGTFRAYLPHRTFYRSSDNQPFTLFRKESRMPEVLDEAQLEKFFDKGQKEIYLLFQLGAFISYRLPFDAQFKIGNFSIELRFSTYPNAFFSAGEDYCVYKVTRL